jgi:hypothetical protein
VHKSDVELGARIALLGKRGQSSKRGRVLTPVGGGDGLAELGCVRGTGEAENQYEQCESSVDHARPLRPASIMLEPDDTIKTANV